MKKLAIVGALFLFSTSAVCAQNFWTFGNGPDETFSWLTPTDEGGGGDGGGPGGSGGDAGAPGGAGGDSGLGGGPGGDGGPGGPGGDGGGEN